MSIRKTSPIPSLKRPYNTTTNMTSNLFNLDSPSDTIPVTTHNIDPNPPPNSNLNPPLNNNQQPNSNPSTSQLFTITSPRNPSLSQYIPHTTNSPFVTPTSSPTSLAYNTHNSTSLITNTVFPNRHTFQQQTQCFFPPSFNPYTSNTQSLPTTQHNIITTQPINSNLHTQRLKQQHSLPTLKP